MQIGNERSHLWPDKNTAFLVIHGNGPHRPYETLDLFVHGFYNILQQENPAVEHKLDDRKQSYIRFNRSGSPYIDFYEYYWDRFMVRDITLKEFKDWLKEISAGIKNYKLIFSNYNPPLLLRLFKSPWLRIGALFDCILNRFIGFVADVPIYCLNNQRSSYYKIREQMLWGAVRELKYLSNSYQNYGQIIVVGHSLGSVIAYDALNHIALDISKPNPSLRTMEDLAKKLRAWFPSALFSMWSHFSLRLKSMCPEKIT
jgi:hypothetical protein